MFRLLELDHLISGRMVALGTLSLCTDDRRDWLVLFNERLNKKRTIDIVKGSFEAGSKDDEVPAAKRCDERVRKMVFWLSWRESGEDDSSGAVAYKELPVTAPTIHQAQTRVYAMPRAAGASTPYPR
jgi:hypothetical protein